MTRTKSYALALYVGAALAGAAVGVSVDRFLVRPQERPDAAVMRKRLFDQWHLTQQQRDAGNKIFDDRNRRLDSLRAMIRPQLDSVFGEASQRISQLLTPEQKAIYDQMKRDREKAQRTEKK